MKNKLILLALIIITTSCSVDEIPPKQDFSIKEKAKECFYVVSKESSEGNYFITYSSEPFNPKLSRETTKVKVSQETWDKINSTYCF